MRPIENLAPDARQQSLDNITCTWRVNRSGTHTWSELIDWDTAETHTLYRALIALDKFLAAYPGDEEGKLVKETLQRAERALDHAERGSYVEGLDVWYLSATKLYELEHIHEEADRFVSIHPWSIGARAVRRAAKKRIEQAQRFPDSPIEFTFREVKIPMWRWWAMLAIALCLLVGLVRWILCLRGGIVFLGVVAVATIFYVVFAWRRRLLSDVARLVKERKQLFAANEYLQQENARLEEALRVALQDRPVGTEN